jgi:hypothetical protein
MTRRAASDASRQAGSADSREPTACASPDRRGDARIRDRLRWSTDMGLEEVILPLAAFTAERRRRAERRRGSAERLGLLGGLCIEWAAAGCAPPVVLSTRSRTPRGSCSWRNPPRSISRRSTTPSRPPER